MDVGNDSIETMEDEEVVVVEASEKRSGINFVAFEGGRVLMFLMSGKRPEAAGGKG